MISKPKVKWNWITEEWEVRRDGKRWYGSKYWIEAMGYARVLAEFMSLDEEEKR